MARIGAEWAIDVPRMRPRISSYPWTPPSNTELLTWPSASNSFGECAAVRRAPAGAHGLLSASAVYPFHDDMGDPAALATSYEDLIECLPPTLRYYARDLPHRLGIAPPGGGWEHYTGLAPFRDLPGFADEEEGGGRLVSPEVLLRYRRAHHFNGFFGLLADRLADGQAPADRGIGALCRHFRNHARTALCEAAGECKTTLHLHQSAFADWRHGLRRERSALATRRLSLEEYHEIVRLKVRWLAVPALCLLGQHGTPERSEAFQRAYTLLISAVQCLDDASDGDEDSRLRGCSIPGALGYPAGGLFRAAPALLRWAAACAAAAGFSRFADFLAAHAIAVDELTAGESTLQNELAAFVIAGTATATMDGGGQLDAAMDARVHRAAESTAISNAQ